MRLNVQEVGEAGRFPATRSDGSAHGDLVGAFVLGEADIAIDAHDAIFGSCAVHVFDAAEAKDEPVDKLLEQPLCILISRAVRVEPGLVIVLLKACEEFKDRLQVGVIAHSDSFLVRAFRGASPRGLSNADPIAPRLLALVHQCVGAADNELGRVVRKQERRANGNRDLQAFVCQVESRKLDEGPQLLTNGSHRRGGCDIMQDGKEFVAAPTADEVDLPQVMLEGGGNHAQDLIAHQMPIRIVELLELVNVNEEHTSFAAPVFKFRDDGPQMRLETQAIVDAGQSIMVRDTAQFMQFLTDGSNPRVASESFHGTHDVALSVVHGRRPDQHGHPVTIGVVQEDIGLVDGCRPACRQPTGTGWCIARHRRLLHG